MNNDLNRVIACPWQKVVTTEKVQGNYNEKLDTLITTTVTFGKCTPNCPFYSDSSYPNCKRAIVEVKKHE